MNLAGCHLGSAATVNYPGGLVARPEKRLRARNARTERRIGAVAPDTCPAALFHSGGSQIGGGGLVGRPSHLGSLNFVSAIPESTSRAEKTPRAAEKSDERPGQLAQLGYLFGGLDSRREIWPPEIVQPSAVAGEPRPLRPRHSPCRRNSSAMSLSRQSRLCYSPAGVDLPGGRA